jgi:hypothetical protein
MKREYKKPIVVFESFCVSTNIAADCEHKTKLPSPNEQYGCGYEIRGAIVFTSQVQGCTYEEADGDHNGICYHNPSETSNLFNS